MLQTAKVQVPYILDLRKVICSITNEAIVTVVAVLEVYLDRVPMLDVGISRWSILLLCQHSGDGSVVGLGAVSHSN